MLLISWKWPLPVLPIGRGGWQPQLPISTLFPLSALILLSLVSNFKSLLMDSRVLMLRVMNVLMDSRALQKVLMDCRAQQI